MTHNREDQEHWEEHEHEATVHSHPHYHVTHNYDHRVGGFHHLSSHHEHEHDHGQVTHSHYPHKNFETEHLDEAHIHDHDVPVKKASREKASTTSGNPKASSTARRTSRSKGGGE